MLSGGELSTTLASVAPDDSALDASRVLGLPRIIQRQSTSHLAVCCLSHGMMLIVFGTIVGAAVPAERGDM